MARQKQYATPAARQAAYRQRMKDTTLWVNRVPFQRMEEATQTLTRWCTVPRRGSTPWRQTLIARPH